MIEWKQNNEFGRHTDLAFGNPDFMKLAEAFDWHGERVDNSADLKDALGDCYDEVEDMRERSAGIREAANDLFSEWRGELDLFTNPEMRSKSESILLDVQSRYEHLSATMEQTEKTAAPVLQGFQDYVTFFNHNLNTRAIGTLETTYEDHTVHLEDLYSTLDASVNVSEDFVKALVD